MAVTGDMSWGGPCDPQCPGPWRGGFGAVWGHWSLLGEGLCAGAASSRAVSPQCPTAACSCPLTLAIHGGDCAKNPNPDWKASAKFASLKKKRSFCKFIAVWLRASGVPAANIWAGHQLGGSSIRSHIRFFGARSPSSPPEMEPRSSQTVFQPQLVGRSLSPATNDEKIFPPGFMKSIILSAAP